MTDYFYKSSTPAIVAIVREFFAKKDSLNEGISALGQLFGGQVATMRTITSQYAGGVKLGNSTALDVHWCRPDKFGYRSLRSAAKPDRSTPEDERATIRAEHARLQQLWRENCPARLCSHRYWDELGVNTGNLLLSGGIKFELNGTAYFNLGFQIDKTRHDANVAAGNPTSGWIEGACEILASEFEAARKNKLAAAQEVARA